MTIFITSSNLLLNLDGFEVANRIVVTTAIYSMRNYDIRAKKIDIGLFVF
jgi:hypothetical protein